MLVVLVLVFSCGALLLRGVETDLIHRVAGLDVEIRDESDSDDRSSEIPENSNVTPCERCHKWYLKDKTNTRWLTRLNAVIQCPCRTKGGNKRHLLAKDLRSKWTHDSNCTANGKPNCSKLHPGADGCLLSNDTLRDARQHCCYSSKGKLLGPTHPGVGTPHRDTEVEDHYRQDVLPHRWCCIECTKRNYCGYYRQLRHSSDSHCRHDLDWVSWRFG